MVARLRKKPHPHHNERLFIIIIAHPDDESMFFVPTIKSLQLRTDTVVWVMCLTTGNYDGLGKVRKKELERTCYSVLNVSKVIIVDDPRIQDHPSQRWPIDHVADTIEARISETLLAVEKLGSKWKSIELVSFDSYGISGHVNHQDTFHAVNKVMQRCGLKASTNHPHL